ncbi:hypothetical protein ACXET9_07325 [Brachybacterium sp. DNPG3]
MGLSPSYFIADFSTGDMIDVLPLQGVRLASSLAPGAFSASLDLRSLGVSMAAARDLVGRLQHGRCTLVPVLEGTSTGVGSPPTSRALGEWWMARVTGSYASPIVSLSGPEFAGYLSYLQPVDDVQGSALDPVVTARGLMSSAFTYSQTVVVDLQSWVSHTGAKVPVDIREGTSDYWTEIADLQEAAGGPFEWMLKTGLVLSGWSPRRVTRTLEVGQPELALIRDDITLEIAAPGTGPASLLDATWDWDEDRSATNVNGFGAGRGADQIGPFSEARARATGEPGKSRMISDPTALTEAQVRRSIRRKLAQLTPEDRAFTATMPTSSYTPMVGEVYHFLADASWTRPATASQVKVDGWSWSSADPDVYNLDLVEV